MKKLLSIVLVCILIVKYPFIVDAGSEIEEYLRRSGMPEYVIEQLSEMQKETIYNEIIGCEVTYSSFHSEGLEFSNGGVSNCSTISTADLTITVVAYDATKNGEECTMLFPSFKWNTPVKIQNDVFAYALYSGWEAMEDESLSVWIYNVNGEKVQSSVQSPETVSESGNAYKFQDIGFLQGIYEGNGVFYAKQKETDATRILCINYTHDKTSSKSLSYSISIGPVQVSVSPSSSDYDSLSGRYSF